MVLYLSEVDEFISKANDKLISSKILFDNHQYATSVSAAYYCMFLTAKALLIKKEHYPKSHEGLISLFGQVYVNQGNFDRSNPDQRQFSTTILYDKPVPYDTPNYSSWVVSDTEQGQANGGAYTQFKKANYLGTQSKDTKTTKGM